jgi:hypothetical protein
VNSQIDFCFKPCGDRSAPKARKIGKPLQSSAHHLVAAKKGVKPMPARMNQGIELAVAEHFCGGDDCLKTLGLA